MLVKNILAVVLSVLLAGSTLGHELNIGDSLGTLLPADPDSKKEFEVLYDLAFEHIPNHIQLALDFIGQAEQHALLMGDSLLIVKSRRVKGQLLYFLEKTIEANKVFSQILPIAVRNSFAQELLYIKTMLGKISLSHGKYDHALQVNFDALSLAIKLNDEDGKRQILHNIGTAYYKLRSYQKGLNYFSKSLLFDFRKTHNSFYVLSDIGLCYYYLGDFSKARFYVEKSLSNCGSECSNKSRINIEYALGLISWGEENKSLAERHFLKSYAFAKSLKDTRFQFDNAYLLAQLYVEQRQFKKAEYYLIEVEKLIKPNTPFSLEKIKIYSQFAKLYRLTGSHKNASNYQYKYIQLKDSIYNEELTNSLMQIESEFQTRENKAKILAQEEVIVLKEEIIRRKTALSILIALGGVILLVCFSAILKGYRVIKRMNILLDQKVEERTRELQITKDELLHALVERDVKVTHALSDITETVNRIKGLCYLGMKDVSEPIAVSYMQMIERIARRLPT